MQPSGYIQRPDYRVDLLRRRNRFQARRGDLVLADSDRTVIVDEQDHALVVYFPRESVALDRLVAVEGQTTHCPYKGDASYWAASDAPDAPIAWSYEETYPEAAQIRHFIAFYADRVTIAMGGADPRKG
jgi:uncharacterized protein (DUF427 family)